MIWKSEFPGICAVSSLTLGMIQYTLKAFGGVKFTETTGGGGGGGGGLVVLPF